MGDSPKWVKSKRQRKKERKKERLNNGNNNGQATHGERMAHASRLGQLKKDFLKPLKKDLKRLYLLSLRSRISLQGPFPTKLLLAIAFNRLE